MLRKRIFANTSRRGREEKLIPLTGSVTGWLSRSLSAIGNAELSKQRKTQPRITDAASGSGDVDPVISSYGSFRHGSLQAPECIPVAIDEDI